MGSMLLTISYLLWTANSANEWIVFSSTKVYMYINQCMNWTDAQAYCLSQNGEVASAHLPTQRTFITNIIDDTPSGTCTEWGHTHTGRTATALWLGGLHNATNTSTFETTSILWFDGTSTPFHDIDWDEDQPENYHIHDHKAIGLHWTNRKFQIAFLGDIGRAFVCQRTSTIPTFTTANLSTSGSTETGYHDELTDSTPSIMTMSTLLSTETRIMQSDSNVPLKMVMLGVLGAVVCVSVSLICIKKRKCSCHWRQKSNQSDSSKVSSSSTQIEEHLPWSPNLAHVLPPKPADIHANSETVIDPPPHVFVNVSRAVSKQPSLHSNARSEEFNAMNHNDGNVNGNNEHTTNDDTGEGSVVLELETSETNREVEGMFKVQMSRSDVLGTDVIQDLVDVDANSELDREDNANDVMHDGADTTKKEIALPASYDMKETADCYD
eukprot:74148_1